ncbi:hypothetical protein [Sphingobium phenoxybenzoativorans]|nr:hypothetical protein [Sphingobium phenoxybenzoativorans]
MPENKIIRPRGMGAGAGRRPLWTYVAGAAAILLVALFAWKWSLWQARAAVGAAYGARMTCSCRYVEGRTAESCKGDTEPGMEIVTISDDPDGKAVTGSVPMMAKRTARYRAGFGCLLDPVG